MRLQSEASARSIRSRYCSCASTDIRHISAAPEMTSIKLSTPKPTREILPAIKSRHNANDPFEAVPGDGEILQPHASTSNHLTIYNRFCHADKNIRPWRKPHTHYGELTRLRHATREGDLAYERMER